MSSEVVNIEWKVRILTKNQPKSEQAKSEQAKSEQLKFPQISYFLVTAVQFWNCILT